MLRGDIIREASKCIYCGFCEAVCPTRPLGPHRGYGPRGRLLLSLLIAKNEVETENVMDSIYTCLLCAACNTKCPVGIDIAGTIRRARKLIVEKRVRKKGFVLARKVG